ncbi:MAG TPA: hypothetical protein VK427_20645 [Kofleriaceae bacterium]|nr:hypothetical protein [Kofleriaceae bacterium]
MIEQVVDRTCYVWATLAWDGRRLVSLQVPGAHVDGRIVEDPLLGPAHCITSGDQVTAMSAIDWSAPTTIPTVAAPARLAPSAGGAIMNVIAMCARDAGVTALRYRGRYPTSALFRTLLRSFTTTAAEDDFIGHFQLGGAPHEVPIDFTPAPFVRISHAHGFVEQRDVIERAVIDGVSYDRAGSPARLVENRAEVWFGDTRYAHVATFSIDGTLVEGPHPIPACTSNVIGQAFPAHLVAALATLLADVVPAPLAEDARRYLIGQAIRWADLGPRVAAVLDDGFAVHAALWERVAPWGMARLAMALVEALAPLVMRNLLANIARDVDLMSPSG